MIAAFALGVFHWVNGGSSKILLLEVCLLPLVLVSFIESTAEAAKTCFLGVVAAFALGGFHWNLGGGSKILSLRRGCCLCAWWVSLGPRRRQQNPASEAWLLPLRLACFMGFMAEAAKSCFQGAFAAFVLGGFQGLDGGGSKFLLLKYDCCL